jgi:hypothetical protein
MLASWPRLSYIIATMTTPSGAPASVLTTITDRLRPIAPFNHALLFLCVSMYLGTGWSLVLFSFPIAPQLTVSNYYLEFVPQVQAATEFFTYMTGVMVICTLVMTMTEWRTSLRWVPLVVLTSIVAVTALTLIVIFPLNHAMSAGITQATELTSVLTRWMALNRVRVAIWTVEWVSLMLFYAIRSTPPAS